MKTIKIGLVLSVFIFVFFAAEPALSIIGEICTDSSCSVSRDNVVIEGSDSSEHHLDLISLNDINHLYSEEFHIDYGSSFPQDGGDQELVDFADLLYATYDEATDRIVSVWGNSDVDITITQEIVEASPMSLTVRETISITSVSDVPVSLWFTEYTDWDLGGSDGPDQVARLSDPRTFTQTMTGSAIKATVTASEPPDHFGIAGEGGEDALLIDAVVAGHLPDNTGPVGPDDVRHAFEYDITLDPDENFTVSFDKTISFDSRSSSVPTLPQWMLLLLAGLLALVAFSAGPLYRKT